MKSVAFSTFLILVVICGTHRAVAQTDADKCDLAIINCDFEAESSTGFDMTKSNDKAALCKYLNADIACLKKFVAKCGGSITLKIKANEEGCAKSGENVPAKTVFNYCTNTVSNCNVKAMIESGLGNGQSLPDPSKLDKEVACKYIKVGRECYGKVSGKCENNRNFNQGMDMMNQGTNHFKCGSSEIVPEVYPNQNCFEANNKCQMDAFKESGVEQGSNPVDVDQVGKEKTCKYLTSYRNCLKTMNGKCDHVEIIKTAKDLVDQGYNALKCGSGEPEGDPLQTCEILNAKCVQKASRESGLENGITIENAAKVGKEVFCKFGKSYRECYKTLNGKCDHVDFIKSAKDLLDQSYNALKCGCGSIVASFALITASLWFLFQRKV